MCCSRPPPGDEERHGRPRATVVYSCSHVYIYIYIYTYIHTYMHIHVYVCMYIYIYIYVYREREMIVCKYMHIYMYIYIYIFIYRERERERESHSLCGFHSGIIRRRGTTQIILQARPNGSQVKFVYIPQRGVQWKQGVVIYMTVYTSLLYNTTPIHCTPDPLHPPLQSIQFGWRYTCCNCNDCKATGTIIETSVRMIISKGIVYAEWMPS